MCPGGESPARAQLFSCAHAVASVVYFSGVLHMKGLGSTVCKPGLCDRNTVFGGMGGNILENNAQRRQLLLKQIFQSVGLHDAFHIFL